MTNNKYQGQIHKKIFGWYQSEPVWRCWRCLCFKTMHYNRIEMTSLLCLNKASLEWLADPAITTLSLQRSPYNYRLFDLFFTFFLNEMDDQLSFWWFKLTSILTMISRVQEALSINILGNLWVFETFYT